MKHSEFRIGLEFSMGGSRWRCTDVGTRTIAAIKLEESDPSWFNGPPYAVAEYCLDEDDMEACECIARGNVAEALAILSRPGGENPREDDRL